MPEINIAPPPSPVSPSAGPAAPAADPAVQGPGAAPGRSQGASEDKGASDFAKVLKKQIDESVPGKAATAPSPATPAVPAAQLTAEPALPAETPPADALASLLPMIFGNIAAPKAEEPATTEAPASGLLPPGMPEVPAAALAAPITTAPVPPLPAAPELPDQDRQPPGKAAAAQPAILATAGPAESSEVGTEIATAEQGSSFEALLSRDANATESARAAASAIESAKSAVPATPAPAAARMGTPMGNPGWNNELGEKLVWMVSRQDSRAELVLNPPQLGRIEVSLTMNGDQANALFVSANPSVRDSLENALPRLREILLDAGITLGQAQVGAESANHSAGNNDDNGRRSGGRGPEAHPATDTAVIEPAQWMRRGNGLVDVFA